MTGVLPRLIAAARAVGIIGTAMSCDGDGTAPDECQESSVDFAACSKALTVRCGQQTTAEDCVAQGPFTVDIYTYACNWARRVSMADVAMCTTEAPSNRCVAVAVQPRSQCADGCSGDTSSLNTLVASDTADELLVLRCHPDGSAVYPIDSSSALRPCSPNTQPGGRA